jgi:hypothetical protein
MANFEWDEVEKFVIAQVVEKLLKMVQFHLNFKWDYYFSAPSTVGTQLIA